MGRSDPLLPKVPLIPKLPHFFYLRSTRGNTLAGESREKLRRELREPLAQGTVSTLLDSSRGGMVPIGFRAVPRQEHRQTDLRRGRA